MQTSTHHQVFQFFVIKFLVLDFKSLSEKFISTIGFLDVTIINLLSISIILNKL